MKTLIIEKLQHLEQEMRVIELWSETPPAQEAFESEQPFALDTMEPAEWLQWILIPRMYALIEQNATLPSSFSIAPYFEEAYKHEDESRCLNLLTHLRELDAFFTKAN
ncbi:YqcC family protein [Moellerella wisconsensis]|uniref:YqcC family protein n=1 Tax=Moellerella wisconsensis TaxID=158849 RepID=UPI00307603CC